MGRIASGLLAFRDKYMFWLNIPSVTIIDIVEIILIAFMLYSILVWIKNTRAWALFKGIITILTFVLIAALFQMNTILWIAENTLNVGLIALVIIFQPELRKMLEQLGEKNTFSMFGVLNREKDGVSRISDSSIEAALRKLVLSGELQKEGKGKSTCYFRVK